MEIRKIEIFSERLGQKFVVTADSENLTETGEFGLWTEQEIETLDGCNNAFIKYARTIGLTVQEKEAE